MRRTREIEFGKTIQSIRANDQMLSIPQHTLLYRTRRADCGSAGGGGDVFETDGS
jgi:hypothetical protein